MSVLPVFMNAFRHCHGYSLGSRVVDGEEEGNWDFNGNTWRRTRLNREMFVCWLGMMLQLLSLINCLLIGFRVC